MTQTEQQRRAYLEAIGIDLWVPRGEPDIDVTEPALADNLGWDELRSQVAACRRCALHETRTQTVFGVGNAEADWMVVGEAPGVEEDRRGEPFVGPAGKLLDEMLRACSHSRQTVFIANVLKCRPPRNRDPQQSEADACRAYLQRQLELVNPKIILAVGKIAAQQLLQSDEPVGRMRGRVHQFEGIPLVVTYHPAYLLRSPEQKAKTWADLCLAQAAASGRLQ